MQRATSLIDSVPAAVKQEINQTTNEEDQSPYQAVVVGQVGSMSPMTEKDTPAFEQAVKRNNLEQSDRGDEVQQEDNGHEENSNEEERG